MFVSGILTLLQSTLGSRLPIIQGGSFAFLVPTLAILSTSFKCLEPEKLAELSEAERTEEWQIRIREIQGAIIVASLFEICLGFFGTSKRNISYLKMVILTITEMNSLDRYRGNDSEVHYTADCC
jgi:nucleobase transporter 1/2